MKQETKLFLCGISFLGMCGILTIQGILSAGAFFAVIGTLMLMKVFYTNISK